MTKDKGAIAKFSKQMSELNRNDKTKINIINGFRDNKTFLLYSLFSVVFPIFHPKGLFCQN